jgi:ABC-2 type transport system permease protein
LDLAAMSEEEVAALPEETLATIGALFAVASEVEVEPAVIEVYASPDWRISTSVVKSVVTQGVEMMNIQMQGMMTVMERIVRGQLEAGGEMDSLEGELALSGDGVGWEDPNVEELPVQLEVVSPTGRGFNWLDYSATSMAILFLMFAVTSGGRTLLAEREGGTLPRLLVSPTPPLTVLLGKMAGVALTGVLQVAILWGATTLLLDAYWGHPLAAAVSIVMLVLSATGVGAVISAWSTSPVQAGTIGTAFTLVGAATAGTFVPRSLLPEWLQQISLVTPQAWAIEIFSRLQTGRTLVSILPLLGGLFLLTVLYYVVALLGFRRQFQ